MDDLTKIFHNLVSPGGAAAIHQVKISYVKNVGQGDFNQARRTIQALIEAGLDPELAALGLVNGHDEYTLEKLLTEQRFFNLRDRLGEIRLGEDVLVAYQLVDRLSLQAGEESLTALVVQPKDLQIMDNENSDNQAIKMTAIIKKQQRKLT